MTGARGGLCVLCLLLIASLAVRVHAHRQSPGIGRIAARDLSGGLIDLGEDAWLPRSDAGRRAVPLGNCARPASVELVRVGFYASDPSNAGTRSSGGRVVFVYQGRSLAGRLVTVRLNAIYFARRASVRLGLSPNNAADDWAAKVVLPAGCDASPEDAAAALRVAVRSQG